MQILENTSLSPGLPLHTMLSSPRIHSLYLSIHPKLYLLLSLFYFVCLPHYPSMTCLYIVAAHCKCEGLGHANVTLLSILEDEGEGVVARKPHSEYEPGRSRLILKIKVTNLFITLSFFRKDKYKLINELIFTLGVQGCGGARDTSCRQFNVPTAAVRTPSSFSFSLFRFTYPSL